MSKMATMVVAAAVLAMATGCEIAATNGNNCGNIGSGEGGSGGSASSGDGGAPPIGPPDGGIPLSSSLRPIPCGGMVIVDPDGAGMRVALEMPWGSYLKHITADITPPSGHTALSALPPTISFAVAEHGAPLVFVPLAMIADQSTSVATYETPHTLTLVVAPTGPGLAIDNNLLTYAGIGVEEKGDGAQDGTVFSKWICWVRLGSCVDLESGEALPAGTPCGLQGKCNAGGKGQCVEPG